MITFIEALTGLAAGLIVIASVFFFAFRLRPPRKKPASPFEHYELSERDPTILSSFSNLDK